MQTLSAKDAKYGFGRLIDLARADRERRELLDRLLSIIDINIPAVPKNTGAARRERY